MKAKKPSAASAASRAALPPASSAAPRTSSKAAVTRLNHWMFAMTKPRHRSASHGHRAVSAKGA